MARHPDGLHPHTNNNNIGMGGWVQKCACSELSRSRRTVPLLSDRVRIRTVNEHKFWRSAHRIKRR
eukprot:1325688-Prymnesium_polylepis.1